MPSHFYYKGIRVNALGFPVTKQHQTKKKPERIIYNVSFESPFKKNTSKDLLIIYDIPESKRKERDWFRRHLKKFGYNMIQRSVWVGPSPLPEYFVEYVKEIGLGKKFITFKLARDYGGKNIVK